MVWGLIQTKIYQLFTIERGKERGQDYATELFSFLFVGTKGKEKAWKAAAPAIVATAAKAYLPSAAETEATNGSPRMRR